jgi:uncharacterized protein YggE
MTGKRFVPTIVLSILLIALTAGCSSFPTLAASAAGAGPNSSTASTNPQVVQPTTSVSPGITVVGTGTASGSPDVANVSLGVQTQNASVEQAVKDNQDKMNAVLAQLKALGIPDSDIQTSNYSIYTQQPAPPPAPGAETSTPPQVFYVVNNQVEVKVRDLSKLSAVLDQSVTAGANNINGVSFSVSDPSKLEADARAKAVADAQTRAQDLAQLEGVTLGNVISVSDVFNNPGPIYAAPMAAAGGGGTPIQTGQLDVTVNIVVVYGIK